MNVAVIIPTLNAAADWDQLSKTLLKSISPDQVLIVDSSSSDSTPELAEAAGFRLLKIERAEFNHGTTRQRAAEACPDAEILVYLTQDAVLASADSLQNLLVALSDPEVGAAYGRQLPRPGAGPIEAHARLYNYPARSNTRTLASRRELGFKTIFISNSFAAYRRSALMAVGGFPGDVIFGEDTITAAKLLFSGWKIAYVADASVYHSHSYTWRQEFRRYFDIGVLHGRENWLVDEFGTAGGEGGRFVKSELRYVGARAWWLLPSALIRTALKLAGYRLGRIESSLPLGWKRRMSMHRPYWK